MTSPEERKPIEGGPSHRKMVVAVTTDGVCEVEQFLAALPARAKAQFKSRFEHYCAVGYLRNPDQMRKLQCDEERPPVHEIKVPDGPGYRLFGIVEDNLFVATHGAKKPKESTLKKHAKRAREAYSNGLNGLKTSEGKDRP